MRALPRRHLPPMASDDSQAWKQLDDLADCKGPASPQFVKLHAVLTARYPCICDLPEADIDHGVWSDGPLINNFGSKAAVIGMVYSRVDEVLPFVIDAAHSMGMVVFDWATKHVHRPGIAQQPGKPWWRFW